MNAPLPLGFDFPLMSALSVRPPWAVPPGEWLEELDEELAARERAYPIHVRDRRMKQADADRHVGLLAAVRMDLVDDSTGRLFAWEDKVRELRRELAIRRNAWPRQIAGRRMRAEDAARRMERLEAVHWRYWIALDFCDPLDNIRNCAAQREAVRAWAWRIDQWERAAADAGDRAARPDRSSEARAAFFAAHPDRLAAARAHGFANMEGIAA